MLSPTKNNLCLQLKLFFFLSNDSQIKSFFYLLPLVIAVILLFTYVGVRYVKFKIY